MPRPEGVGGTRSRGSVTRSSGGRPSGVAGRGRPKEKKEGDHVGVGGFFKNLGKDIGTTLYGAVPGIYHTAKDVSQDIYDATYGDTDFDRTRKIGKAIADSYSYTYGSGDLGETLHRIGEHPFGPILDATAVFTGGAGLAAKTGAISAKAGTPIVLTGRVEGTATKLAARGTTRAIGQKGFNKLLETAPEKLDKAGLTRTANVVAGRQDARVAKVNRRALDYQAMVTANQNVPFLKTLNKIRNKDERVAAWALSQMPLKSELDAKIAQLKATGTDTSLASAKILERPGVQKRYENPTARMEAALEEARVLAEKQRQLLDIPVEMAEERRFLHAQLARGATFDKKGNLVNKISLDDLKAEYAAAGRPEPIYLPDLSKADNLSNYMISPRGGGLGGALRPGSTRHNEGILFSSGQLIMDPSVLNSSFLRASKFRHYQSIHSDLIRNARQLPHGQALPKGWEYVRKKRTDRISHKQQTLDEFEDWAKHHLDDEGNFIAKDEPFTTGDIADAIVVEGKGEQMSLLPDNKRRRRKKRPQSYLIVPTAYSRHLRGEFTRTSALIHFVNTKPLRVWRALVLGLRPAWLVNNILGNTMMYLMRSEPQHAAALAASFRRMLKPNEQKVFDELTRRHFPVATQTFIGTQFPHLRPKGPLGKILNGVNKALPTIDRKWDETLRKAFIEGELRKRKKEILGDEAAIGARVGKEDALISVSQRPAIQRAAQNMRQETLDFWQAAAAELERNPRLAEEITNAVHDALGNFENLTGFERNVVRSVFPFYAWFKAITAVTFKLPLDHPLRVDMIHRLAQVATESYMQEAGLERDKVPDFLQAFIPIQVDPDGRIRGISTQAMNPYITTEQVASFVAAVALGKPGRASNQIPSLNPFYKAFIEQITGHRTETNAPAPDYGAGPIGNTVVGVGASVPQWRVIQAWRKKLYTGGGGKTTIYDRDPVDETLRFLGSGYARVSKARAYQMKQQETAGR